VLNLCTRYWPQWCRLRSTCSAMLEVCSSGNKAAFQVRRNEKSETELSEHSHSCIFQNRCSLRENQRERERETRNTTLLPLSLTLPGYSCDTHKFSHTHTHTHTHAYTCVHKQMCSL